MQLLADLARVDASSPALRFGGLELSYGELRAKAAGLRAELERRGLAAGDRVALSLPHGLEAPAAVLAAWSGGFVAVPLEPRLPPQRVARVLARSGALALVAPGRRGESLARRLGGRWPSQRIDGWEHASPGAAVSVAPELPASILFTSGSTGEPKGVVISRAHVDAFTGHWGPRVGLGPDARVAQVASLAFDLSLFDVGATLRSGATIVPVPEALLAFPQRAVALLADWRISHLYTVPSLLESLLSAGLASAGHRPDVLMSAGEALSADLARRLLAALPGVRLLNLFGPTETNVSCAWELPADFAGQEVPIGQACPYIDLAVVDGELLARGATVTPGYWAEPERAEWVELRGRRWLRTGDRVREGHGLLWFAGRADRMVKLRGYRLEPEEVERALAASPGVIEAAVVPVPGDQPGSARSLVAFVVTPELHAPALLAELGRRLPAWALPDRIIEVPALPRTDRGKVDLVALAGRIRLD